MERRHIQEVEDHQKGPGRHVRALARIGVLASVLGVAGWYVLDRLREELRQLGIVGVWFGGGDLEVRSLAFAPDGERLAVGYSYPALTCIWDTRAGSQSLIIREGEHEAIERVAFSPDGKLIAVAIKKLSDTGTKGTAVRIRNVDTGELIRDLDIAPWSITFSPDGKLLAARDGVRKMPEGLLARELAWPAGFWLVGLDFSPDGSLLAAGGFINPRPGHPETIALVFAVKSARLLKSLKCPDNMPHATCAEGKAVDFHPDGKRLAIGTVDDAFYIWNIETDEVKVFRREGGRWWAVRFSPNGELLAASGAGGTVLIWDVSKQQEVCALKGHVLSVYGLEFSPKGDLLASGGMDGTVRLWGLKGLVRKQWGLVRKLTLKLPGN